MLRVTGGQIVESSGAPIALRGTCVGGWMNMEDFINGYPGSEHGLRSAITSMLGTAKAEFFFERLLDHFFTEDDVVFMKQCGATVVRLPLNYRHFEQDRAPFQYVEDGFKRLDRAIRWCAKYGLYVILDLHAVQGWQNTDWHSDNANRHSLFWQHPHFQDRWVALWEQFARRYRDEEYVAGYNVMNEPVSNVSDGRLSDDYTPDWPNINRLYRRVVDAIRAIDPDHIIFLEGDYYSRLFDGLEAPFAPNLVYSSHNYTRAGFGPGPYPGELIGGYWDRAYQIERVDEAEGTVFSKRHNVPLWVGEFGSIYNGPPDENPYRMQAMADQIDIFNERGIHWTTWVYKDVGVMGWVHLDPRSEYMQRLKPVHEAKRQLAVDFWMQWLPSTPAKDLVRELARLAENAIDDPSVDPAGAERYLGQAALAGHIAALMQPAYARRFEGLSESEIDRALESFAFKQCLPREELLAVLRPRLTCP
ncbi:MAG: glycoside hydrolase family 5 protein [Chloroflexi bacterium]|nr:glycoside hydrolase family 5 protein [Chloroflexota bacterium]